MAGYGYSRSILLAAGTSSSSVTSPAALTADWNILSLSWQTATGSASTLTVQGTLFGSAGTTAIPEAEWSALTTLTAKGMFTIDPGPRYVRVLRGSPESASTVWLGGRVY